MTESLTFTSNLSLNVLSQALKSNTNQQNQSEKRKRQVGSWLREKFEVIIKLVILIHRDIEMQPVIIVQNIGLFGSDVQS